MKIKCAILDDYQNIALKMADWSAVSGHVELQVIRRHIDGEEELLTEIGSCQILLVMRERTPITAALLTRLPELKLIVTTGMRNASIDIAEANKRGILVCGTASSSAPPVELTWALILGLARNIVAENEAFRNNGPWQSSVGSDLSGKELGIVGLGKIGKCVARVGLAFGMKVTAWSQNLSIERTAEAGVRFAASKEELLERSDIVSVHLVLSDRTRGLIGSSELRRMKSSAYIINTSRAQIVDSSALIYALRNGWIAGAGLDVFDVEPVSAGDELRTVPRLLATPHLGYVSYENYRRYFCEAVEDIVAFLAGTPIRTLSEG